MKYVRLEGDKFILFPDSIDHSEISKLGVPISAGFCDIKESKSGDFDHKYKYSCWGKSKTLNLCSQKEDAELMEIYLGK